MRYRVCPESLMTVCTSVVVIVGTTSGLVAWLTTVVESSLHPVKADTMTAANAM